MKRYFITGIGTDVGKTFCAAVLTEALQADYWKPVQTGNTDGSDKNIIRQLISNTKSVIHQETYSYEKPVSPHIAASLEDETIKLDKIIVPQTDNTIIIEGAGGLLVPLNQEELLVDLIAKTEAEVILVIREYLGCINHSLLSLNYLQQHKIPVKGLLLNGNFHPMAEQSIIKYSKYPVLAKFPELPGVSKTAVFNLAKSISPELFYGL